MSKDVDSDCFLSYETEETPWHNLRSNQTFLNGIIVEYSQSIEAHEPLNFEFNRSGHLEVAGLWLEGAVVFRATFEKNLVRTFYASTSKQKFKKEVEGDRWESYLSENKNRFVHLKEGKSKLEKLMAHLCKKFRHQKTCAAYKSLKVLPYPLMEDG